MNKRIKMSGGFTLVEMMISITLGIIVIFGIGQIFVATRTSYASMQGLSGMQQSARFAMNHMGNAVRAGGDMGFSNSSSLLQATAGPKSTPAGEGFYQLSNFAAAGPQVSEILRASSGVSVYEFVGSAPGDTVTMSEPPTLGGTWSPPLPAFIGANVVAGSDVVVTRFMSARTAPFRPTILVNGFLKACSPSTGITVGTETNLSAAVLTELSARPQRLYAIADANNAVIFQGVNVGTAANLQVTTIAGVGTPGNIAGQCGSSDYLRDSVARVGEFNIEVYYIGLSPLSGETGLWRMVFDGSGATGFSTDELVENVESMQVTLGLTMPPAAGLGTSTGVTDRLVTGAALANPGATLGLTGENTSTASRRIVSVRLALLGRSEANAAGQTNDQVYNVGGVTVDPVDDRRLRQVYEQNIGLRNRHRVGTGTNFY